MIVKACRARLKPEISRLLVTRSAEVCNDRKIRQKANKFPATTEVAGAKNATKNGIPSSRQL